jgi:hypothetical protein
MTNFFVGLDLGQANDYTALSILEKLQKEEKESIYHVRHLERIRGMPYPDIVNKIVKMMCSPKLDSASLIIDQTGVGAPVVDLFKQAGLKPIGVLIHGGDKVTHEGGSWRVPKRDLVGVLQVLLQTSRLKVASKLALGSVLSQEMLNFKVTINPETAHDSYSAWREADHDDLVLCVALACWWGAREPKKFTFATAPAPVTCSLGYR